VKSRGNKMTKRQASQALYFILISRFEILIFKVLHSRCAILHQSQTNHHYISVKLLLLVPFQDFQHSLQHSLQHPQHPHNRAIEMPSVFDRLYNTETASSAGKRVGHHEAPSPLPTTTSKYQKGGRKPQPRTSTYRSSNHSPASKASEASSEGVCSTVPVPVPDVQQQVLLSNAKKAPSAATTTTNTKTTKFRLLCSSKYHPNSGFSELSPSSLHLVSDLYRFENGDLEQRQLATCIIDALWNRDFSNGKHWDIDSASVSAVAAAAGPNTNASIEGEQEYEEDDDGGCWKVSKSATWDWKDIYAVAESKGLIRFRMDAREIRIANYSYYVAG
jgi:hypothetical protein